MLFLKHWELLWSRKTALGVLASPAWNSSASLCFASPVICISPPSLWLIASFDTAHPRSLLKKAVWEEPGRDRRPGSTVAGQEGLCRAGKDPLKNTNSSMAKERRAGSAVPPFPVAAAGTSSFISPLITCKVGSVMPASEPLGT